MVRWGPISSGALTDRLPIAYPEPNGSLRSQVPTSLPARGPGSRAAQSRAPAAGENCTVLMRGSRVVARAATCRSPEGSVAGALRPRRQIFVGLPRPRDSSSVDKEPWTFRFGPECPCVQRESLSPPDEDR